MLEKVLERIAVALERQADAAEALAAAAKAGPVPVSEKEEAPAPEEEAPKTGEKPKKTRRTRRTKKAEPTGPTIQDAKNALREVSINCGAEETQTFLNDWEIKTVNELDEEDYEDFISQAKETVEECGD
jgi:hypothetical protein